MLIVVTGGSGSGKSEYAENIAVSFGKEPLIYIATMLPFGEESKEKIQRHRQMREKKRFQTLECFTNLSEISFKKKPIVLLECMSNLLANEMFLETGAKESSVEQILAGVMHHIQQAEHVIIVTNEISSDGLSYDEESLRYMKFLGIINARLADIADQVIEVVYSIPVFHKGIDGKVGEMK